MGWGASTQVNFKLCESWTLTKIGKCQDAVLDTEANGGPARLRNVSDLAKLVRRGRVGLRDTWAEWGMGGSDAFLGVSVSSPTFGPVPGPVDSEVLIQIWL